MQRNIALRLQNLSHWFGDGSSCSRVLHNINLHIEQGEVVGLVGPSGCGKSTLLRAIVGTHPARQGQVVVDHGSLEHPVPGVITHPSAEIGIVYQQYSLMPHLTARKNVALGPKLNQSSIPYRICQPFSWMRKRLQHLREADELLVKLGLENELRKYPAQLSGGQRQRVALAQCLIMKHKVLLLDEPFSGLDEKMRQSLQYMMLSLLEENQKAAAEGKSPPLTIILVTHSITEAIYICNRVVGLSQHYDWQKDNEEFPGATIVYDKPAPIFHPGDANDLKVVHDQRQEIYDQVMGPDAK